MDADCSFPSLSAKVFHIPFIQLAKGLELHSIVQRSPREGNSAPDDFPSVKHFTFIESMLEDSDIDLVVVATPPNNHFKITRQVLQSNKHVLVEKPIVPTSKEAEELAQLAKERGKLICVYQNRRWDADFLTVQKLLRENNLGRVYEFNTHFDRYRPHKPTNWKAEMTLDDGNGAIYDLGTHLIDQLYVLFGKPTTVYGKFLQQRGSNSSKGARFVSGDGSADEQPDSVYATLTYADKGLLAHVRIGVLSVEETQPRFWVRGTRGSYHKLGVDPQEEQLISGMKAGQEGFGVDSAAYNGRLERAQKDGSVREFTCPNIEPQTYLRFYELLAKALVSGREEDVPVRASEARDVLQIIEAIRESARSGREVAVS